MNKIYCCSVTKSCPTLVTPWTVACLAPASTEFSRQEYWSGLPLPAPGSLPDPGVDPVCPPLAGGTGLFAAEAPGQPHE